MTDQGQRRGNLRVVAALALVAAAAAGWLGWRWSRARLPAGRDTSVSGARHPPGTASAPTPAQAAASVREAVARGAPERLTPLVEPAPFDRARFEADPDAYLRTVEPGRCFQSAEPTGAGDVPLLALSLPQTQMRVGERVALMVKSVPGAPVTFTSFAGGFFVEDQLGSVTVRANREGVAAAHFTAGPGTSGDVPIQVGSPLAVGNQTFLVRVLPR